MDHFRGLFDKLDKNKDGFISREELHSEMRRIGVEPVCEKVQVRFSIVYLDINCGDVQVIILLCSLSGLGYTYFLGEQIIVYIIILYYSFVQAILSHYDQNEDGRLSYQEFLIYIMDREKKWKIDFHALDRNKCGKLYSLVFFFFSFFLKIEIA